MSSLGGGGISPSDSIAGLETRAERTDYKETSRYTDVIAILDSLGRRTGLLDSTGHRDTIFAPTAPMRLETLGISPSGKAIPYVVASRPMVRNGAEAHRIGRPVVYLEANIHAGEVEGKEAVLEVLRELLLPADTAASSLLDSIVIVAVPIYNVDGNEAFRPQDVNRPEQNGPAIVGQRANGQGLDLNRDFVKAEAPETRGTLALLQEWDPDVFVDFHTTDGTFHGYALTYAPPLNPASMVSGPYTRDTLLPELQRRMRERHRVETFAYGNLDPERGPLPDTVTHVWATYDHRPRFGTNYVGLRGRVAILSEAYSHDPFARRIAVTRAFLREILSLVAERRDEILDHSDAADSAARVWAEAPDLAPPIPIRAQLTRTSHGDSVLIEDLEWTGDSTITEPGVPRGVRRTGRIHPLAAPVLDRFDPTVMARMPFAYAVPASDSAAVRLLEAHGIIVQLVRTAEPATVERFEIDSVVAAPTAFQGHHTVRLVGRWTRPSEPVMLAAGSYVIPCAQSLGVLAVYLLEPLSDDGLVAWNFFDRELEAGGTYPVMRISY